MVLPIWIDNLVAYSLQIAILAAAGTLLAYIFRLRLPRVSLVYWQVLLLACLFLPVLQKWEHPVVVQTSVGIETKEIFIRDTGITSDLEPAKIPVTETLLLILAAGAALRLIWLGLGFLRLRLYLRKSEQIPNAPPDTDRISSLIGVQARFFISDEIDSPATFGIFKPTVLLPRSFPEMSEACREAVVYHELLHVRRRDWALVLLEEIIRTILWFHPAVWWLLSRIRLTREQSVDLEAVKLLGSQQPYLDSLLEIARMHGRPKTFPAPLFLRERHLVQRVALLIKEVSMNRLRLALSLTGIVILLAGTVSLAAGWFPLTGTPEVVQEETSDTKSESQQIQAPAAPADPIPMPTVPQRIRPKQSNGKLQMNYTDADLRLIIKSMSDFLGMTPLIIDPQVQGTTTIHSSEPMSKDKALALFHQVLKTNNASLIEQNGIYQVVPIYSDLKTGGDNIEHQAPDVESETTPENSATPPRREGGGMGGDLARSQVNPTLSAGAESYSSQQAPKRIDEKDLQSKLIQRISPEYPGEARGGEVILDLTVNEKGDVTNVAVLRGDPLHIDSVVAAAKQWKYEPTLLNGTPIPVIATVTVKRNIVLPTHFVLPTEIPVNPNPDNAKWIEGNVLQSKLIHKVDPEYPELAKRARVKGKVTLAVTVNEEGYVSNVEVLGSHPMLRDASVKAVKQWKYEPTVLNGKAIPVIATVIVNFVLPEDTETDTPVGELRDPNVMVISLDESGQVSIDKEPVPIENLGRELQKIFRERPNKTLFLRVPANVNFSDVKKIVDIAKEAGADEIGLVTAKNR